MSKVQYQAGMILVRDGEHRCARCREELPGMKSHLEHLGSTAVMPDAFFQELARLCDALGVPCPDGRSSPHEYMKKCVDAAEHARRSN